MKNELINNINNVMKSIFLICNISDTLPEIKNHNEGVVLVSKSTQEIDNAVALLIGIVSNNSTEITSKYKKVRSKNEYNIIFETPNNKRDIKLLNKFFSGMNESLKETNINNLRLLSMSL